MDIVKGYQFFSADECEKMRAYCDKKERRGASELPFHTWDDAHGPTAAFDELLKTANALDSKRIVLDEAMRADFAALVQEALPDAKSQFTASTIGALRMRKDESEYDALKRNAIIADTAMQAAWAAVQAALAAAKPGVKAYVVDDA